MDPSPRGSWVGTRCRAPTADLWYQTTRLSSGHGRQSRRTRGICGPCRLRWVMQGPANLVLRPWRRWRRPGTRVRCRVQFWRRGQIMRARARLAMRVWWCRVMPCRALLRVRPLAHMTWCRWRVRGGRRLNSVAEKEAGPGPGCRRRCLGQDSGYAVMISHRRWWRSGMQLGQDSGYAVMFSHMLWWRPRDQLGLHPKKGAWGPRRMRGLLRRAYGRGVSEAGTGQAGGPGHGGQRPGGRELLRLGLSGGLFGNQPGSRGLHVRLGPALGFCGC